MVFRVFADSPHNHHFILDYLKPMPGTSLIRVDNHEDLVRCSFGYSLPCARYMNAVFLNKYFENVFWIKKSKNCKISVYEQKNEYSKEDYDFDTLKDALAFAGKNSFKKIVLDIDPDILHDYPTGFTKGSMERFELKGLVEYFENNKEIELFFLAESESFLDNLLKKCC
jgi:hypothetical protein